MKMKIGQTVTYDHTPSSGEKGVNRLTPRSELEAMSRTHRQNRWLDQLLRDNSKTEVHRPVDLCR